MNYIYYTIFIIHIKYIHIHKYIICIFKIDHIYIYIYAYTKYIGKRLNKR